MIGFTKVVLKGIDGPVNEIQTTDLTTAFNGGQRMLALISQLVEIARINNGNIKLVPEERNPENFLGEITDRWKIQNPAKPLTTDIQLSFPAIRMDVLQMRQLVVHSLTFAAIRISEGTLHLTARDNDKGLNITVQSTGTKANDKMEMDTAMLSFIIPSLVKLLGGSAEEPQERDEGLLLNFSLPL